MSRTTTRRIEVPWHFEDRDPPLELAGTVTLGGRWPRVEGVVVFDPHTEEELDMPDWALEQAELILVGEAERVRVRRAS
jgi:hypothetical protein